MTGRDLCKLAQGIVHDVAHVDITAQVGVQPLRDVLVDEHLAARGMVLAWASALLFAYAAPLVGVAFVVWFMAGS